MNSKKRVFLCFSLFIGNLKRLRTEKITNIRVQHGKFLSFLQVVTSAVSSRKRKSLSSGIELQEENNMLEAGCTLSN